MYPLTDCPPCKTLNVALGNLACDPCSRSNRACDPCPPGDSNITNMVFELGGGHYRLEGCVGLVGVKNVTIQSNDTDNDVIIECESFPNNDSNFGNLYVCGSTGVVFRGIVFTRCGPQESNVFLNNSSGVVFDNCTFT